MKKRLRAVLALMVLTLAFWAVPAAAQKVVQQTFASPEEAFKALVAACSENQTERLLAILGPGSRPLVESGDPIADTNGRRDFVKAAEARTFYVRTGDSKVVVDVGFDNWPVPIPIVKKNAVWVFDSAAGLREMLDRRIGRNELDAIETCRAIVEAQRKFYNEDLDGNGVKNYAARVPSTPGTHDGLYWPSTDDQNRSPLGPLVADAQAAGYTAGKGAPYHGYVFRMLKEQGPNARGGAFNYSANGNLVAGFAIVAWPAEYGNSGLTTFLVNANGVILQKDLGPDTSALCLKMRAYNPDKTWKKVK